MVGEVTVHTNPIVSVAERYILDELSKKPREGWLLRGVPRELCESRGGHSRKLAIAARAYASIHPELDAEWMIRAARIHDAPEVLGPDYTPHDNISTEKKHSEETQAMESLRPQLREEAESIIRRWHEYEAQATPEARIVWQLDKMEPVVQALIYARAGYKVAEFYPYARSRISEPRLVQILDTVHTSGSTKPYQMYYQLLRENYPSTISSSSLSKK